MKIIIGLWCVITLDISLSARILGYFPMPSISHQVVFRGLIDALAKRGHHIVIITPDPLGPNAPPHYENVTEIDIHDVSYKIVRESFNVNDYQNDPDGFISKLILLSPSFVDDELSSPLVREFINTENQTFDLVLGESLLPISFAFGAFFRAPYIGVCSLSGRISNFEAVGTPTHSFLYPDNHRQFFGKLDFWKKISILKSEILQRYAHHSAQPMYNEIIRKHFGHDIPSIVELENNMDMLFVNQHPILAGPRPTVPAVVYMGNMHLKPQKPLPQDLNKILDDSKQGVVYFSLGSNIMSKYLSKEKIKCILEAFSELKYTVLWKFENDTLEGRPGNVHISKWFPQMDLLGHPNVKVFITQGGLQSLEEALFNKVPLVGIPFIGDQNFNVENIVEHGIGIRLNINTLTKYHLKEAIIEVAEGKSYHKNIERLSILIADQPMTGKERAVWWTEYVLRHGGARHLRAPAADVTWIKYFMLDVLVPLLLILITFFVALYMAVVKCFRSIFFLLCSNKLKTN